LLGAVSDGVSASFCFVADLEVYHDQYRDYNVYDDDDLKRRRNIAQALKWAAHYHFGNVNHLWEYPQYSFVDVEILEHEVQDAFLPG
jgi:hypothetical protein